VNTRAKAQPSRERILEAALDLMSERGYAGTTMSMITKRSGLPPSSTYWHFGSKGELLAAVVEYCAGRWLASLPRWEDLDGQPEERLRALLASGQKGVSEPFMRLILMLALEAPQDAEWMGTIRRVRRSAAGGFRKAYNEIIGAPDSAQEQVRRDELARFALATLDGIILAAQVDEGVDVPRMFALLDQAFLCLSRSIAAEERTA